MKMKQGHQLDFGQGQAFLFIDIQLQVNSSCSLNHFDHFRREETSFCFFLFNFHFSEPR